SESVGARAHDVADLLFVAKDFLAVRIQLIFALKEIGAAPVNLIVTVCLGVFDGHRMVEAGELLQLARERHGAGHGGTRNTLVDVPVTLCTGFRPEDRKSTR